MRIPVVELPDITICEEQSIQAFGLNCRDKQIEDEVKHRRACHCAVGADNIRPFRAVENKTACGRGRHPKIDTALPRSA